MMDMVLSDAFAHNDVDSFHAKIRLAAFISLSHPFQMALPYISKIVEAQLVQYCLCVMEPALVWCHLDLGCQERWSTF